MALGAYLLVLLVFGFLFGLSGFWFFVVMCLFLIPVYSILGYWSLDAVERVFLSVALALGLVSSLSYSLTKVGFSLRWSFLLVVVVLAIVAFVLHRFRKR